MKKYPKCFPDNFEADILPAGAKGETVGSCGPCQLTSEREERHDTHVDWWIYEKAEPHIYFHEVSSDE